MSDPAEPQLMVWTFPAPTHASLQQAWLNLRIAAEGTDAQKRALGDPTQLPRPWDPASLTDGELRYATWRWLDDFVAWFNHEQVWNPTSLIPACWPRHPHLVHQIAVLADLRRQAGEAFTSQPLEEWHRYAVPAFIDRMRQQLSTSCDKAHSEWPGASKFRRLLDTERDRIQAFNDDVDLMDRAPEPDPSEAFTPAGDDETDSPDPESEGNEVKPAGERGRYLRVVPADGGIDPTTGEIL